MLELIWLIPLLPMLGAFVNGILGRRFNHTAVNVVAIGAIAASFVVTLLAFIELAGMDPAARFKEVTMFTWIAAGTTKIQLAYLFDPLSAVMCMIITGVGSLIHIYSAGYMHHDPGYRRFFTYLNLFCFAMLTLVLGNNFLVLFVGWEGVGLCSYLLIGFWFEDQQKAIAGMKAFVVNRIGDFGFLLAMFFIFWHLGTLNFREVMALAPTAISVGMATVICLLLFVGATGKSAQLPLYVWLPDAMAGPTPVSALIHAATMVTAGVYMIGRCNVLFSMAPAALNVVAWVGAATALFAGLIAITQNDIKKVLAYSTVSQLGYMFLAMGSAAYVAGIFHLMTHAFFKACLFLGSGSVIHGMHEEQDMRKMGNLRKYMPHTFITFLIATVAIAGIPPLAGFFSKDEILWMAFSRGFKAQWVLGFIAAGVTAFYMFRLVFMTFYGTERHEGHCKENSEHHAEPVEHGEDEDFARHCKGHAKSHIHESPPAMYVPLYVLMVLSVIGGWVGIPAALGGYNHFHHWLAPVLEPHGAGAAQHAAAMATQLGQSGVAYASAAAGAAAEHHDLTEYLLMFASVAWALLGISLAYFLYLKRPDLPGKIADKIKGFYELSLNKFYVDEIYDAVFIKGCVSLANHFWKFWDVIVIDGFVNGLGKSVAFAGSGLAGLQTGKAQSYVMAVVIGAVLLVGYAALRAVF